MRKSRQRALTLLLVCLAALLLVWPALVNRYPLLFPDTIDYLAQGRCALNTLLHAKQPFHGMRSAAYALLIYPFHRNRNPWPILLLNAATVSYTVFLTVRTFSPRHAPRKSLLILIALSLLTALPWYIGLLMPDVLGAPLYLALFLLTFARAQFTRAEQLLLALIVIAGATAHSTHLLLALLLLAVYAAAALLARWSTGSLAHWNALVIPASVLAAAILFQLTLNARLFHRLTLDGNRPPYLEARLLADGPAKSFLLTHCPDPQLPYLCAHTANLPLNDDDFLWGEGLYATATPASQQQLLREELPLARATLRAYPLQQLRITLANIAAQLTHFGLDDFDNNGYMQQHLDDVLPNARSSYDRSLQARNAMPWSIPTLIQNIAVILSLLLIAILFRRVTPQLRALTATVFLILLANAALAGALSEVDSRYQSRIIWLLPLLAALYLLKGVKTEGEGAFRSLS